MKLTPWFPPEIKPVRNGVYERRLVCMQHPQVYLTYPSTWNGKLWIVLDRVSVFQNAEWRGLAEAPKKRKDR